MTTLAMPICAVCARLIGDLADPKCTALPLRIPSGILSNEKDHRQPFAGDNGKQVSPRDPEAAEYAELIFKPWPSPKRRRDRRPHPPS